MSTLVKKPQIAAVFVFERNTICDLMLQLFSESMNIMVK